MYSWVVRELGRTNLSPCHLKVWGEPAIGRTPGVVLDVDLAEFYGVPTKRLNEQVKRNRERFPQDFVFQLTSEDKSEVVANCDHLANLKYSKSLPYTFTGHGTIMAASVLNSTRAIEVSVFIIRAFVKLR
jgi:hypothetical protein